MIAETTAVRQRIQEIVSSQKQPTVTILSSLLAVQDELNYIPKEAIEEIADYCHATINDVWGVASFYTNFRFSPPGRHELEVCWGPTCHLKGASRIIQGIQESLGLSAEGDTEDMSISLRYNTCLGTCAHAPVISIDHKLIGGASLQEAQNLVASLTNQ